MKSMSNDGGRQRIAVAEAWRVGAASKARVIANAFPRSPTREPRNHRGHQTPMAIGRSPTRQGFPVYRVGVWIVTLNGRKGVTVSVPAVRCRWRGVGHPSVAARLTGEIAFAAESRVHGGGTGARRRLASARSQPFRKFETGSPNRTPNFKTASVQRSNTNNTAPTATTPAGMLQNSRQLVRSAATATAASSPS